MPTLPHLAHIPMPLAGDGSSVAHVVRAVTREHALAGGRSTAITSHNRVVTYPDAETVPVDCTRNCPRTHFTPAEYRQDWAAEALLREPPHAARPFEPAAEALGLVAPNLVALHEGHYAVTALPLLRRNLPATTRIAFHVHNALPSSVLRAELSRLLRHADRVVGSAELREAEGTSGYEQHLRALAARVAGPVTLEPYQPQEEVAHAYRWADVVAVPSHAEPFGMVPLEAMVSGAFVRPDSGRARSDPTLAASRRRAGR